MRLPTIAVATMLIPTVSACGLIFTDTQTTVSFTSDPPGAEVTLDGAPVGRTPVQVMVSNRKDHQVTMQHEGGEPTTCMLGASLGAGWLVLDILFGLIPVIVDAATDGWTTLDQEGCHAVFRHGAKDHADPAPVSSAQ